MKTHKMMLFELNNSLRPHFAHAVITMLVSIILSSVVMTICALPAVSTGSTAFMFVGLLLSLVFSLTMVYSYFVIMYRFVLNERVVIGHIFDGFRNASRVIPAVLLFILFSTIAIVIVMIPMLAISYFRPTWIVSLGISGLFYILAALYIIAIVAVMLRYAFLFLTLYTHSNEKLTSVFKKSATLLKGHRFNFILFCLKSGGLALIIAVVAYIIAIAIQIATGSFVNLESILQFLSSDATELTSITTQSLADPSVANTAVTATPAASILSVFSSLLDLVYFVSGYIAIIRIAMGSTVYFCNLSGILPEIDELPPSTDTSANPGANPSVYKIE